MPLISLIIVLIIVGLLLYVADLLPIDPQIKLVIRILVVLAVVLWLLSLVGLIPPTVGVVRP